MMPPPVFLQRYQPKSPRFTEVCFAGGEPIMTISRFAGLLDIIMMLGISLATRDFEEARSTTLVEAHKVISKED